MPSCLGRVCACVRARAYGMRERAHLRVYVIFYTSTFFIILSYHLHLTF